MWTGIASAAIGSIAGGLFGKSGQSSAQKFAEEQSHLANLQQERLYKNRYTWQMEDLKRAGLNPALAYSQGAGSAGSAHMANMPDFGLPVKGVSAGIQLATAKSAIDLNQAQAKNLESQAELNSAKTAQEEQELRQRGELHPYNMQKIQEDISRVKQDIEIRGVKLPYEVEQIISQTQSNLANAEYGSWLKILSPVISKLYGIAENVGNAVQQGAILDIADSFLKRANKFFNLDGSSIDINNAKKHFENMFIK